MYHVRHLRYLYCTLTRQRTTRTLKQSTSAQQCPKYGDTLQVGSLYDLLLASLPNGVYTGWRWPRCAQVAEARGCAMFEARTSISQHDVASPAGLPVRPPAFTGARLSCVVSMPSSRILLQDTRPRRSRDDCHRRRLARQLPQLLCAMKICDADTKSKRARLPRRSERT